MESDQECGEKWQGSFTKYSPDSCSWKTHQCSLLGDLDEFLETWPQWGLMRDGECWEQRTLEQSIRGTESGLSEKWATPTTMDKLPPKSEQSLLREATVTRLGRSKPANLRDQVSNMQNWPTPNSRDWKDSQTAGNRKSPGLGVVAHQGTSDGGQLNPDWVEWLMNWPIKWSDLNGFNKQEFQRWQEASAEAIQGIGQMRTMWWDSDPSQTPLGQQPVEQPKQEHSNSLPEMSWDASCKRKMERSQQGSDLSLLRKDLYIQETERKDLQQRMREQTCLDEAQIVPRVSKSIAARVDRLKAIGNGQVPLCAATAWRILNAGWI